MFCLKQIVFCLKNINIIATRFDCKYNAQNCLKSVLYHAVLTTNFQIACQSSGQTSGHATPTQTPVYLNLWLLFKFVFPYFNIMENNGNIVILHRSHASFSIICVKKLRMHSTFNMLIYSNLE